MKTRYIAILAGIFSIMACSIKEKGPTDGNVSFHAVNGDAKDTKTVLQADGNILWSAKDKIDIFVGTKSFKFTGTNTTEVSEATFTGSLDGPEWGPNNEFWAVYPHSSNNSSDGSSLSVSLPGSQKACAGTFDKDLFISVAKSQDYNLSFFNVCGGIKFSVTEEGVKSVTFKGKKGEALAGTAKVAFDQDGKPIIQKVTNPIAEVTLSAPEGSTLEVGKWYYIVCFPTVLENGYVMTLNRADGKVAQKDGISPVTIKRSIWGRLTEMDKGLEYDYDSGLFITEPDYTISCEGGTIEVEVRASVEFSVTPEVDWISYVQTKALTTSTVVLSVAANPIKEDRVGKVNITSADGKMSGVVTITQDRAPDEPTGFVVVGYSYRGRVLPNTELLTHINYAFGKIKSDFETLEIKSEDGLKKVVALKNSKPDLKVLLSIGGWGAGNFSEMAADETHRKNFCQNCLNAVNKYNLDGIDLDWEYPTSSDAGISSSPDDTKNFTLLCKDLRNVLGSGKLLTMASASNSKYVDWPNVIQYLDWVNLMTYDMGNPPYHNAGLYKSSKTKRSCDESVKLHSDKGVPYDKIVLGMPFYGRDDKTLKPFTSGDDDNFVYYKDISTAGYNVCWDGTAMVPYLTNGDGTMVLTYDDKTSIGLKADYVKQKELRGAMYWAIEGDDDNWTLSKTIASTLLGWTDPSSGGDDDAFLATNQYIQKYLEEVDYTLVIQEHPYGDSDNYGKYTKVTQYPGGGPSVNDEELPPTYTITWSAASSKQTLKVWEGDWSREYSLKSGVGSQDITNLVPNTTYHWKVTASGSTVASGSFATKGLLRQVYYAPNVRNGRDLGGYKGLNGKTVAYHKLFRGGAIHGSRTNSTGKAEMLAEGIRAEVDLREAEDVPDSSPLGSSVDFYAPGFDSGYNHMVRDNPDKVKDTFCWVVARLREGKPVYFHCSAGRDRTATLAILLEGVLGVSESDMAKDYELTYFTPADWGMSENGTVYKHYWDNYSYPSVRKTIFKNTDSGTYQERIVKYLLNIGVPQADIDDLRSIMLK